MVGPVPRERDRHAEDRARADHRCTSTSCCNKNDDAAPPIPQSK